MCHHAQLYCILINKDMGRVSKWFTPYFVVFLLEVVPMSTEFYWFCSCSVQESVNCKHCLKYALYFVNTLVHLCFTGNNMFVHHLCTVLWLCILIIIFQYLVPFLFSGLDNLEYKTFLLTEEKSEIKNEFLLFKNKVKKDTVNYFSKF